MYTCMSCVAKFVQLAKVAMCATRTTDMSLPVPGPYRFAPARRAWPDYLDPGLSCACWGFGGDWTLNSNKHRCQTKSAVY